MKLMAKEAVTFDLQPVSPELPEPASCGFVPYESQSTPWTCGAAALTMVYRSFGFFETQDEVWRRIDSNERNKGNSVASHRLAADALKRGFAAMVLRVHGDWLAVRRSFENDARCIVNHRLSDKAVGGHFSVLTEVSGNLVFLNDPSEGRRRVKVDQFLRLWSTASIAVTGGVLVVIGRSCQWPEKCPLCSTEPSQADPTCEGCGRLVPLQPFVVLGCLRKDCPMRSWVDLFCPWCDTKIAPNSSRRA
jgi:hypothetical protein